MVRANVSDRVIERLGEKGGHVIRTNLDNDAERHRRKAFERAHAEEIEAHQKGQKA